MSFAAQRFDAALAASAWLQELKSRQAIFVKRHNLAIENRFLRVNLLGDRSQLGILGRHLQLIARHKACFAATDKTDRAKAVPLGFKDPFGI